MSVHRLDHLIRFYLLLDELEYAIGGSRKLSECHGRMSWPRRGVYFFREDGEPRNDSGAGPRIVRVGTHALNPGSGTKLWTRLAQHRGRPSTGGGNHRGSIFRLLVGAALIRRDDLKFPTWDNGSEADKNMRAVEIDLERLVSQIIGSMTLLWLPIDDEPGQDSRRGYIEHNAIALLSNHGKLVLDDASKMWLGHHSNRERVRASGLWNQNHVEETYDPAFLDVLSALVGQMGKQA